MARRSVTSVQSIGQLCQRGRSIRDILAVKRPELARPSRLSNKMAVLGLAVGYLGLVAVLASVPVWNQSLQLYQAPPLSCTVAGGGR